MRRCDRTRTRCSDPSISEFLKKDVDTSLVTDFYVLGKAKVGVGAGEIKAVEESLWSLQYSIPGAVTAFMGSVSQCRRRTGSAFDFAVCFRFQNPLTLQRFSQNEAFQKQWEGALLQKCEHHLTLVAQQRVCNELETLFRRGALFEEGVDHLLLMRLLDTSSAEAAVQFASVLSDVLQNSEIGAVSTSLGVLSESSDPRLSGEHLVLASHLSGSRGVTHLEAMPPIEQLWEENGNGLLRAELSFAFEPDREQ